MADKSIHDRIADDRAHYLKTEDADEWEEVPAPSDRRVRRQQPGVMISVRLSAPEADEIRAAADAADEPVSAFVRKVVLDHIHGSAAAFGIFGSTAGSLGRGAGQVQFEAGTPVSGEVQSSARLTCMTALL